MGCSKIKEKLNCCKRESLKEKARKYHLSYKAKEEEVSLVEGQKEAYKVPQEYGVAKFDPVRVAKILERKRCGNKNGRWLRSIGWLTLRMSSTSRRIMIYPIIFLLGYYFIQINYQFETRLMCLALNLTDEGPTATTGSSGSGGSSDQTAGQTGGAPPLNMTDAPCYKDAQAKFGMWRARSKLIIRIITFLLGFYAKTIWKQYQSKISKVPDAENAILEIGGLTNERAEEKFKDDLVSPGGVLEWKKTVSRYCLLSWTMCFNTISNPLAAKLGTGDQLIEKGLITEEELTALVGNSCDNEELAALSSDLWWIPITWALNLVRINGIHAEESKMIIQKDHNKATGALVKLKMALESQKAKAETRLPSFYKQILHNVLFAWVVMSMGMSQDTQHWREMVALDPGLSPNTAKIKALFDAFPVVTIAIQLCLLGWLFMADILDNPYGYNIEYDENLEEELEVNIWRCSLSLQQQCEVAPESKTAAAQKKKIWETIKPVASA